MTTPEEIKSLLDPTAPLEPKTLSLEKLQEKLETSAETCRILREQIQNVLFELKTLLNGSLDVLLIYEPGDIEAMENLRDLLEEETEPQNQEKKERYWMDTIIIRSRISGALKTILINIFSGYKDAIDTLIENLNELLQEFDEAYEDLMNTYSKLLNQIGKEIFERFQKDLPIIKLPRLPKIKRLPIKIDPTLLTREILEKNLDRYYGERKEATSSEQPPVSQPPQRQE